MNSQDLKNLIDYIMDNNSQKEASYITRGRKQYRYVDFRLDTMDGVIYNVVFRNGDGEFAKFEIGGKEQLDKIYKWLDKEVDDAY